MAKKSRFDGVIVKRDVDPDGYVFAYDKNDRSCWDNETAERVILSEDLRKYGEGLHKGQLGWTVPGSSDGYKWVEVHFDSGPCIPVLTYGLDRVVPEKADAISKSVIASFRGTRFDADASVAEVERQKFIRDEFSSHMDFSDLNESGDGTQEVYAYTFPSLVELAYLKNQQIYPVKIGYTAEKDIGAFSRIRSQIFENAAFPEKVKLLCVFRCDNGRQIETKIHRTLRESDRHLTTAIGREWFLTNAEEVVQLVDACARDAPNQRLQLTGDARDGL